MKTSKGMEWTLRAAVAGEFVGHAAFSLEGKEQWVGWITKFGINSHYAPKLLFAIGLLDLVIALTVLIRPVPAVLLWAAFWGFWTALLRPLVGQPIWDFIERWPNWGAPLALYFLGRQVPAPSPYSLSYDSTGETSEVGREN